jgi:hypothetical protein
VLGGGIFFLPKDANLRSAKREEGIGFSTERVIPKGMPREGEGAFLCFSNEGGAWRGKFFLPKDANLRSAKREEGIGFSTERCIPTGCPEEEEQEGGGGKKEGLRVRKFVIFAGQKTSMR